MRVTDWGSGPEGAAIELIEDGVALRQEQSGDAPPTRHVSFLNGVLKAGWAEEVQLVSVRLFAHRPNGSCGSLFAPV